MDSLINYDILKLTSLQSFSGKNRTKGKQSNLFTMGKELKRGDRLVMERKGRKYETCFFGDATFRFLKLITLAYVLYGP